MENNDTNIKLLLAVAFDESSGSYKVDIPAGSTIAETVFGFSVVIKCLLRDGLIESPNEIYDMLKRYTEDPQYQELKSEDNDGSSIEKNIDE